MAVTIEVSDKWVRGYVGTTAVVDTRVPMLFYEPAVGKVADRIAFYNELVDVTVDGVILDRPVSVFSQERNRPSSQ